MRHGIYSTYTNQKCRCGPSPADRLACQTWREQAACAGMCPDVFFPVAESRSTQEMVWGHERALTICHACQVTDACLAYALDHDEEHGVWGATTPDDRQALDRIRQRRPRPDPDQVQR